MKYFLLASWGWWFIKVFTLMLDPRCCEIFSINSMETVGQKLLEFEMVHSPPPCFVRLTFCHVIIVISSNNPMFLFGGWVKYSNSPRYPLVSKYGSRKWTFWSISYWKWGFQLPCYLFHQRVQVPASFLHLWIWRWVIARKTLALEKTNMTEDVKKCISGKLQHGDCSSQSCQLNQGFLVVHV